MSSLEIITFIDHSKLLDKPRPASHYLPDWYKDHASYSYQGKVPKQYPDGNSTIKKCIPVFDSMTAGYILETHTDIYIDSNDKSLEFTWANPDVYMNMHLPYQAEGYPNSTGSILKYVTPWSVKTPNGWSVLVLPPMHRDSPIHIMPALIDTDSYHAPLEFPFLLKDKIFKGVIPKGTPIAQLIPIKRQDWVSDYTSKQEDIEVVDRMANAIRSVFFDRYKKLFWNKKSYK